MTIAQDIVRTATDRAVADHHNGKARRGLVEDTNVNDSGRRFTTAEICEAFRVPLLSMKHEELAALSGLASDLLARRARHPGRPFGRVLASLETAMRGRRHEGGILVQVRAVDLAALLDQFYRLDSEARDRYAMEHGR